MHVESFKFQNRILIANHGAQQSIKEKDSPLFLNFPASRGFFFFCNHWAVEYGKIDLCQIGSKLTLIQPWTGLFKSQAP